MQLFSAALTLYNHEQLRAHKFTANVDELIFFLQLLALLLSSVVKTFISTLSKYRSKRYSAQIKFIFYVNVNIF